MTTQQQPATSLETPLEIPFNIPLDTLMFAPLAHWAAGYEYAFGYQWKLLWDFWGFTSAGR